MTLITATTRQIQRTGQPLTLRRIATGTAPVSVSLTGLVRGYQAHELLGGIVQGDRRVTIANTEIAAAAWPGPPRKGDQVLIAGATFTVQSVATEYLGATIARHDMQVRG